ncbi:MAG: DUF1294 domain-containing protein [Planctomycetia bacterium]|jgi:uncharacterized membrane protein YsdA (DUF1294 family)
MGPLATWIFGITAAAMFGIWIFAGTLWAFVTLGVITFLCYGLDKYQARRDGLRISEKTLHILALCGGTPGAALGQIVFRHKTRKRSFRLIFFTIVFFQAVALIAWIIY